MPAKTLYYRPIETHFIETFHSETRAEYTIRTVVGFYSDEAMQNLTYTKEMTFEKVAFRPEWMGVMGEIYELISNQI